MTVRCTTASFHQARWGANGEHQTVSSTANERQFTRMKLRLILHLCILSQISCRDSHGNIGQDEQDLQHKTFWQRFRWLARAMGLAF